MPFRLNYIVPNICSIIRCISDETGFSIILGFLCQKELTSGKIKLLWEGNDPIENTLYFANRKKTIYADEIQQIQNIFEQEM